MHRVQFMFCVFVERIFVQGRLCLDLKKKKKNLILHEYIYPLEVC
jgi:hypothetical protein